MFRNEKSSQGGCKAKKRPLASLLAAALVLACGTVPARSLTLAEARKAISEDRGRIWKDPQSIRDAKISAPHQCPHRPEGAICVCVEANAKNAFGGYAGLSKSRIYFQGGKVVDAIGPLAAAAPDQCGAFLPFPEISKR